MASALLSSLFAELRATFAVAVHISNDAELEATVMAGDGATVLIDHGASRYTALYRHPGDHNLLRPDGHAVGRVLVERVKAAHLVALGVDVLNLPELPEWLRRGGGR